MKKHIAIIEDDISINNAIALAIVLALIGILFFFKSTLPIYRFR